MIEELQACVYSINKNENEISVLIENKTNQDEPEQLATLMLDEIDNLSIDQFSIGTVLKILIGQGAFEVEIVDLGKWTQQEIDEAEKIAKEMHEYFNRESK